MLEFLELAAYDWSLRWSPKHATSDPRIVLVTISEHDIRQQGQWPLTDHTLAQLLNQINRGQPRVIGLDLYRDFKVPPGHEELNQIFLNTPNIIGVMKFPSPSIGAIPGPAILQEKGQVGFNDMLPDPGGTVRRGLLFLDDGKTSATSFALTLAAQYLSQDGIMMTPDDQQPDYVKLGVTTLPPFSSNDGGYSNADDQGYQMLIQYYQADRPFHRYGMTDVLGGQIATEAFQDKIVLIGVTAESVKDLFVTPYSQGLHDQQLMSGMELHAHMVSQLLRIGTHQEQPLHTLSDGQEMLWIAIWCLLGSLVGVMIHAFWFVVVTFMGLSGFLGSVAYFSMQAGWWIPSVPPILGLLITGSLLSTALSRIERDQRKLLMELFSKHVSPEVADMIWEQRDQFFQGGRLRTQRQVVTALFADLEGFTPIAERLSPQELIDWLNTYMEAMATIIMNHHGVVDDYYGDAIKANFGVPFPRTQEPEIQQDAQHAVACALAMKEEIIRLNQDLQFQNLPTVRMRIGLFTGLVVAGSLGSAQRLKYTTIGDAVNIAARLESLGPLPQNPNVQQDHCRILIGETTRAYVDGIVKIRDLGDQQLKGKAQTIKAYQVLGKSEQQP